MDVVSGIPGDVNSQPGQFQTGRNPTPLELAGLTAGPTGLIVLVRRPFLEVKIDGVTQTGISSVSCHFGFDARYATAEIVYKSVSGVIPTYWMPVEIIMGAGTNNIPRFYGYILPIDNTSFPKTGILHCRGPLGIAAALGNAANDWNPISNTYGTDFMSVGLSGSVTKTAGSANIVGTGTAFTSELAVGMPLVLVDYTSIGTAFVDPATALPSSEIGVIVSIADDTNLTLDTTMTRSQAGVGVFRARSDQEIAVFILNYYGLASRFVYTPPFGGGLGDTVAGTGNFLGVLPTVSTWVWPTGVPGLNYLDELDKACAAQDALSNWGVYKTIETVGGEADKTVFRTLITANPQLTEGDANFSLTEGVDLFRDLAPTHDPQQVVNSVRVTGGDPFQNPVLQANFPDYIPALPATPPPYLSASSPYLPSFLPNNTTTGYPTVQRDFSFPMIERSVASDPWYGLTAEDKARQLLQELNTEVVTLQASTYRDDLFGPGQTHYIGAPIRAGVFQTMWLNSLDITMSARRVFRQRMVYTVKN